MADHIEIAHRILSETGIRWCDGSGCQLKSSHKRGFVMGNVGDRVRAVHFSGSLRTRAGLYRLLHEVGHVVAEKPKMHRWEREQAAERYARDMFRENGIPVPLKCIQCGNAYITRMKRWGDNVKRGRRRKTEGSST